MPPEDIQTPKAPKNWQPTSDQRQQIEQDRRLRGMSRDEQYYYFNKPKTPARARGGTPAPAPRQAPQQRRVPPPSPGIWGWVDSVLAALGGGR